LFWQTKKVGDFFTPKKMKKKMIGGAKKIPDKDARSSSDKLFCGFVSYA
jgi:hypothetical protein